MKQRESFQQIALYCQSSVESECYAIHSTPHTTSNSRTRERVGTETPHLTIQLDASNRVGTPIKKSLENTDINSDNYDMNQEFEKLLIILFYLIALRDFEVQG